MKSRNISYLKKLKARRILGRASQVDLKTLLSATMELCKSNIVKKHVKNSIQSLESSFYRLSA
ncbi:MAG: hypothetical protein EOP56_12795 [Sphingobacteriales bacterium]|nr:MAG: hypothetical protein EOP56_12795 [Sphingobacteriales bacterium]